MIQKFQIFGSQDSQDYDVMVFVKTIPDIELAKDLCYKNDKELYMLFVNMGWEIKKVNSNLAVLDDGVIIKSFKGTPDEVNNSMYYTYDFHQQLHPNQITKLVERDIDLKIMRTARVILSFLSKTSYRTDVKIALHGNFIQKISTLSNIDISKITDIGTKNVEWKDYLKVISFQLGQTISLMKNVELYTKSDIGEHYPDLIPMLKRDGENLQILEKLKHELILLCKERIPKMKKYEEYKK